MPYQQKRTGRAMSMQGGLAFGTGISVLISLVSAGVIAKLVDREIIMWEDVGYGIMITLLLASFTGALTASKRIKRLQMVVCLTAGGIYFAALLCMTALFFGGQYESVGITALLIFAGCMSAALLGMGRKKTKRSRIRAGR